MSWLMLLEGFVFISGSLVVLSSAVGMLRFPDVFCRSHAVGKGLTLGIFLLLMGLWMHLDHEESGIKILIIVIFQFITIPVASHILGLLAYQIKNKKEE